MTAAPDEHPSDQHLRDEHRPDASWPDDAWVLQTWPPLGSVVAREAWGSGVRLTTAAGLVHLKRRPPDAIHAEVWILDELSRRGVPVTVPQRAADGQAFRMLGADAYLLYRELPGLPRTDYWSPDATQTMRMLGAAGAHLHRVLARLDVTDALMRGLHVRRQPLGHTGPVQIIHRDFHAGNVLFDGRTITGYLDFDHLELGPRFVDVCYAAGSALARLHESGDADRWLPLWHGIVAGYHRVSPLTRAEVEASVEVTVGIEQDFADWFEATGDPHNAEFSRVLARFAVDHADEVLSAARRATGLA